MPQGNTLGVTWMNLCETLHLDNKLLDDLVSFLLSSLNVSLDENMRSYGGPLLSAGRGFFFFCKTYTRQALGNIRREKGKGLFFSLMAHIYKVDFDVANGETESSWNGPLRLFLFYLGGEMGVKDELFEGWMK